MTLCVPLALVEVHVVPGAALRIGGGTYFRFVDQVLTPEEFGVGSSSGDA